MSYYDIPVLIFPEGKMLLLAIDTYKPFYVPGSQKQVKLVNKCIRIQRTI